MSRNILKSFYNLRARIGGDEFVMIMPNADTQSDHDMLKYIWTFEIVNNKFYRDPELSLSVGVATSQPGISPKKIVSAADNPMCGNKAQ